MTRATRLLRWLGPWTEGGLVPEHTVTRQVVVGAGGNDAYRAWVFRREDRPPDAALLLVPGLHYAGPEDPRMSRFARVLARAGFLVLAPCLPDFLRLVVGKNLVRDTSRALDALLAQPDYPVGVRPGLFSISFGSMPTLRVAAERSEEVAGVVVFGGFADFHAALRFALQGDATRANDPLNAPVVFINLLKWFPGVDDAERALLADAFLLQCKQTWGREESKVAEVYAANAERIAHTLPSKLRETFMIGCRARPGTSELALDALARSGDALEWIDPRPYFEGIRCPVRLVHGRDDDVIPHEQSAALEEALTPHTEVSRYLTGLYGHTQGASPMALFSEARAATAEVLSLVGILRAISGVSGRHL